MAFAATISPEELMELKIYVLLTWAVYLSII